MLGEGPHELSTASHSKECKRSPQQFIPAGFPPPQPTSHGDGRLSHPPHYTGHGPFRTRPPTSVKSFRSRNNCTAQTIIYRKYVVAATRLPSPLRLETISARNGPCPVPQKSSPDSPSTTTYPRGRNTQPAPSPPRTWSVPDVSSQPQLNH